MRVLAIRDPSSFVIPASRWIVIPDAPQARAGIACRRRRTRSQTVPALRFAPAGMTDHQRCTAAGSAPA